MTQSVKAPINLSARTARLLSLVVLACLSGGYLFGAVAGDASKPAYLAFAVMRLVGLVGALALFIDVHGQTANAPDTMLDERQRGERDRAYVRSHQIIVFALFAAFLYTIPATKLGWWLPEREDVGDLLSAFGIAALALPGIILAWRAPAEDIE